MLLQCQVDTVAPAWTRKAHPAFGDAVYSGQPNPGIISCQLVHSPDPSCVTAATQALLGLLFFMETPWLAKMHIPKYSYSLCTALVEVCGLKAKCTGSTQAEKGGEGPSHSPHTHPAMVAQVLMKLSGCTEP